MHAPLLTLIVFSPLAGALLLLLFPGEAGVQRRTAFALSLIPFALFGFLRRAALLSLLK